MKIDNSMAQQAYAAYRNSADPVKTGGAQQQPQSAAVAKPQQPDKVELSAKSRQYSQALAAARNAPATRADLVASLRTQVQNGTYQVDSQSLATAVARHVDVRA